MLFRLMKSDLQQPTGSPSVDGQACPAVSPRRAFTTFSVLGTVVWAIWNESFAPMVLVQGVFFSCLALLITNRFLLKARYPDLFWMDPVTILRFLAVLVLAIFQSGIHAIYITLTGRIDVRVMDLPTRISTPFHGVLIANAITLTPGTVTIDHSHGSFKVIWIECLTNDPEEAGDIIKGRFERVFATNPRERN